MKKEYLVGIKFNLLTLVEEISTKSRFRMAKWSCSCGGSIITRIQSVELGYTKSCGCLKYKKGIVRRFKHGMSKSPEYQAWADLKDRCYNPNNKYFFNYGGRGIKVCDRWLESFENFFEDMGYRPSKRFSIERVENNGIYEKNNCKWGTKYEQERNKRSNVYLEYNGKLKIVKDWSKEIGISNTTISNRIKKGFPISDILKK